MCCLVMACVSCFVFFVCYSMCSNHCGDLEVAPLSFVMRLSETRAPTMGSTRSSPNFCVYCSSPVPRPSYCVPQNADISVTVWLIQFVTGNTH